MSNLAAILQRTQDECKDSLNAYATQRTNFIADICKEITTTVNFRWLEVTITETYEAPGGWIPLPSEVGRILAVGVAGQPLTPITESEYFKRKYEITNALTNTYRGYFRYQWYDVGKVFQINPINVDFGTDIDILYRRFLTTPDQFPDYFDECIVQGVLWKFMQMLEGDDMDSAQFSKIRYMELLNKLEQLWNPDVQSDENTRVMTQDELDYEKAMQYYNY